MSQSHSDLLSSTLKPHIQSLLDPNSTNDLQFHHVLERLKGLELGANEKSDLDAPLENALITLKHLILSQEASPLQLSSYLEQFSTSEVDRVQQLVATLPQERIDSRSTQLSSTPPTLVDIQYSLHFIPRSKSNYYPKWEYYLNLVFDDGKVERIVCDVSEMEDLVAQLQDATKEVERTLGES